MRVERPIGDGTTPGGDQLPLPSAPLIGGGRYALVAKIAEGGMAGVYRAWDARLRVWRAVKVLLPEYAARRTLRARFEAEAETMARIDHPHVIRVYDVRTAEVLPYLVMELATGGTLARWLELHGAMPPALACRVMAEVAAGLGAAHDEGVIHRDVKPQNVIVTGDGRCKLTDFGIAQVDRGDITRTGSTMGTIGYMAPEQRSDARQVDARADVYSLGALLYKLVTGVMVPDLFLVEHEPALLAQVPPVFRPVVVRACHHDRERRFDSAAAFGDTVRQIGATLPPDPVDTPPLSVPAGDTRVTDDAGFPEIAELLEASAEERVRAIGAVGATTPFTIASAPPRRDGPRGDLLPSSFSIGSDSVAPVATDPVRPDTVRTLAIAAVLSWALLGLLGVLGSWDVSRQAARAEAARDAVYTVLVEEDALLAELGRHGAAPADLAALNEEYARFVDAVDVNERRTAALRYARGIDTTAERLLGHAPTDLTAVRVARISTRLREWIEADQAWVAAVDRPHGRMATALGLAPRP